ncbi:hypothetical protein N1851_030444 [Merluccius polli]|uniref:Uncharacterized protein n=1 Tax=Merluccius polli TaxID=89951 RepID=A0AA47M5B3_MERPO|nr:hypothetical protein N1851_030444 [Merluccius polli]
MCVFYIVKELCGWYREHYRAFELNPAPNRSFTRVALSEVLDTYPLVDYKIGSVRMTGTPVILKIILTDGSCQRLTLSHGLAASVDDLMVELKKQCGLQGNFTLQFMDFLFGNEFLNLTSISEVQDRGTLKVIDMSRPTTISSRVSDSLSLSGGSVDTDVLSSRESTCSRSSWPAVFHVPKFSYDTELKLQQASLAYIQNGTVLIPDPKLKSAILDGLVQEIVQYKVCH